MINRVLLSAASDPGGSGKMDLNNTVDIKGALGDQFFGYKCVMDLVFKTFDFAIIIGGIALFVMLVAGGIEYLTSGGDKAKLESAQKRITSAVIGVAIIASSFAIWKLALYFFGIDAPNICRDNNPLSYLFDSYRYFYL
jgi:hypothetical protein